MLGNYKWYIDNYEPMPKIDQFCPKCKKKIEEIAFCEFCGEPLFDVEEEEK